MKSILYLSSLVNVYLNIRDPFYYFGNNSTTDNEAIRNLARSYRSMAISLAIAAIVITGVIVSAVFAVTNNPRRIQSAKSSLIFKFIIAILIFSDTWILSTLFGIVTRMA